MREYRIFDVVNKNIRYNRRRVREYRVYSILVGCENIEYLKLYIRTLRLLSRIFLHRISNVRYSRTLPYDYVVPTTSRRLKTISLFCKRTLQKRRYSAKETYNFKEPTNSSHPLQNTRDFPTLDVIPKKPIFFKTYAVFALDIFAPYDYYIRPGSNMF